MIEKAMFRMAANCVGIVGGRLFRSDDKPYYHRGWTIIIYSLSLGVALVSFAIAQYAVTNKMKGGAGIVNTIRLDNSEEVEDAPVMQKYNY